jgi:hypothetical protein
MRVWNVLYEAKFNSRGDITSTESPEARLSKKMAELIKAFQKVKAAPTNRSPTAGRRLRTIYKPELPSRGSRDKN